MRANLSALLPLCGSVLVLFSVATAAFAQGGGGPAMCDGYCSEQTAPVCLGVEMKCCCEIGGVWTCVCKLPTDCNSSNGCQDGGTIG